MSTVELVKQVNNLPEKEQLQTLEDIMSNTKLGVVVKLIPRLEEAWGVSAKPQMLDGFLPPQDEEEEEQTAFDVVVTEIGSKKVQVIKAIRSALQSDLKTAKGKLNVIPATIGEGLSKNDADNMRKILEEAGAVVQIK